MNRSYHPFFFGFFPVLFLYVANINEVFLNEIIAPALIIASITLGLFLLLSGLFKNSKKTALILSSVLIFFFSYGHIAEVVRGDNLDSLVVSGFAVFPALFAILLIVIFWALRTKTNLSGLNKFLNIVSSFLILISVIQIGLFYTRQSPKIITRTNIEEFKSTFSVNVTDNLPDVYYLVFDRYGSDMVFREFYDYDNSEFTDFLRDRGFYVAEKSYANYPKTGHSLASSLNMEYINYLSEEYGEKSSNFLPLYDKLDDYRLWKLLKERGYAFVHLGSFWAHTAENRFADVNYNLYPLPEFAQRLYETTALHPFGIRLNIFDENRLQWRRVQYKFEKLSTIPEISKPTFSFAHFIIPHDPYVFDSDGNYQNREEIAKKTNSEGYIDQTVFINREIKVLIDSILTKSKNPPIIVIQGDTGPRHQAYLEQGYDFDWRRATSDELKQKLGILNAVYFPDEDYELMYPNITPVNTFRLILKNYFGEDLEFLPDKNFIFTRELLPYEFSEVTNKLKE